MMQIEKFNYLGSIVTGKCDTEIKAFIRRAKNAIQKLNKLFSLWKNSAETKERVLKCCLLSIPLYASEYWTIYLQMTNKLKVTETWFYRRMLRILNM